jgi:hypothetical protein
MNHNIRITIASPPDREKLVAEIFFGNEQWAELNQEEDDLRLEIYPKQDGRPWLISLQDAVRALDEAKDRLTGSETNQRRSP